jgi:aspartate beta-hydroxylase
VSQDPSQAGSVAARARDAVRRGDLAGAEDAFSALLRLRPADRGALSFLAVRALERGDHAGGIRISREACRHHPADPALWTNLATGLAMAGDWPAARAAAEQGLAHGPDRAELWMLAGVAALAGGDRGYAIGAAARSEALLPRLAWRVTTGELPPALQPLHRAQLALRDEERRARLLASVAMPAAGGADALGDRLRAYVASLLGEPPDYADLLQRPARGYLPGLAARPFFEPDRLPGLTALEASWQVVREELQALLDSAPGTLEPYVGADLAMPAGWDHLKGRRDWASLHLWSQGRRQDANCARFPRTAALMESLPLARIASSSPEVFFSILEPGAHIPPHFGITNVKLATHLALDVPEGCAIRVGDQTRTWREGRCLAFDDSFEHEAWNHGSRRRAVLIFDVWHPGLSAAERTAVARLGEADQAFAEWWAAQALSPQPPRT